MDKNKLTRLVVIGFSPTRTSWKVACAVADHIDLFQEKEYVDLTYSRTAIPEVVSHAFCLVAVPVYAGLVPELALQRLQQIHFDASVVVPIVVYGNRAFDDALLQLKDVLTHAGGRAFAAAAFVGEHSYSTAQYPVAAGRPDHSDLDAAASFAQKIIEKWQRTMREGADPSEWDTWDVPGHFPYRERKPLPPVGPQGDKEKCIGCGICATLCPADAISRDNYLVTDDAKCIKCCACVKGCRSQARIYVTPFSEVLHKNFSARKEPEFFL